jgi:predicted nucleotidyltransferase
MMPNVGLSDSILRQIGDQAALYPEIEALVLYGSRARGDYRPSSDIDLAVVAEHMPSRRFSEFWNALDDLPIIFKIDTLHMQRLSDQNLKKQILSQGIKLYQRKYPC